MMGSYFGHLGWFGLGFGGIFMLVFWVFIIWAILAALGAISGPGGGCCGHRRDNFPPPTPGPKSNQALEILRERYAKGEISKEDFDRMKKEVE